jgi:hypothetical protein
MMELESVLLVVYNKDKNTARLVRLGELPGCVELIEQGRLGDLVTRRVYEQHLKPNYEKDRQVDIDNWLDKLP